MNTQKNTNPAIKIMESWNYEYTDTFGGEANYSWVKRGKVDVLKRGTIASAKRGNAKPLEHASVYLWQDAFQRPVFAGAELVHYSRGGYLPTNLN